MSDLALFLGQLIRKPKQISAVAPSSRHLARAMAASLGPETGKVAEFGAGTGKLTRGILDRGVAPADLTVFELNPTFCRKLEREFPGVRVENRPAQDMATLGITDLGAVVSGLPLLSMNEDLQSGIVGAAFAGLRPGGAYVQFTYGPRPPMHADVQSALQLRATKGPFVLINMPPARVYLYTRAQD